jgi:hypothetical protein
MTTSSVLALKFGSADLADPLGMDTKVVAGAWRLRGPAACHHHLRQDGAMHTTSTTSEICQELAAEINLLRGYWHRYQGNHDLQSRVAAMLTAHFLHQAGGLLPLLNADAACLEAGLPLD